MIDTSKASSFPKLEILLNCTMKEEDFVLHIYDSIGY